MKSPKKIKAPPLGLIPRKLLDDQRFYEVCLAITRYYQACLEIPVEWIEEYNSFIRVKNK